MRISDWSSDVCSSDLVKALDARKLLGSHVGDFLQLGKAFSDQKLRQRLVHIQLVLEHFGACNEFLLPLLAGIGLGHDVDGRTSQLRGKAPILAAAADGGRKLVIGNPPFAPRLDRKAVGEGKGVAES